MICRVVHQSASAALDADVNVQARRFTERGDTVVLIAEIIAALRQRFPALRDPATAGICYATTNRQHALETVAADSDLVLVVGSGNSFNSRRLVELTARHGTAVCLIEGASDIRPQWLATVDTIGLTAGASAPPALVSEVITALGGLAPLSVAERELTTVTIQVDVYRLTAQVHAAFDGFPYPCAGWPWTVRSTAPAKHAKLTLASPAATTKAKSSSAARSSKPFPKIRSSKH